MRQVISQTLTGRYAIVKVFPYVHALKVEILQNIKTEGETLQETTWRLATDKDIIDLGIATVGGKASATFA